jgi:hypothetical protein
MKKIIEMLNAINEDDCSSDVNNMINQAIDELEDMKNRKCQNCKYEKLSKERYLPHHQCLKLVSSVGYDFCCNKWESK